ncbi:MAG: hypothetical protein JNK16_03840 [Phycisphaerales bacterium]|nr:hypothetical protein [Phycisphaerales bacterium]
MTPSLHPQHRSAFLDGKSCATIAKAFSLSVEEVLAWFESDLTQSTLRRLESLQLQQARIVSFSVLPAATGSLCRTSTTAPDPILQTRAASNLVRLGLRFSGAPSLREGVGGGSHPLPNSSTRTSHNSEAPSLREAVGGRDAAAHTQTASTPASSLEPAISPPHHRASAQSVLSDPSVLLDPSIPSAHTSPPNLACESLRAEFAALRTESRNSLSSSSRIRASESRKAIHRSNSAPRLEPAHNHQTVALEPAPTLDPPPTFVTPLLSRRESRIASLRSSAGAIASRDPFPALNRAPPRNSHAPPPMNTAA